MSTVLTLVQHDDRGGTRGSLPTLVIKNLEKRFREVAAVVDVSLDVQAGEIYGLLGPNGAGKSTTINCVTGILAPTSGSIDICGRPSTSIDAKEMLGYVPDELRLPDTLTGREYLRFVSRLYSSGSLERAETMAEVFGLAGALDRLIREYSHGMHKKLQIIGALTHQPVLLILDEPFRGLDPEALMIVREVLDSRRRSGWSTLVATHELATAATMCDTVGIIASGVLKVAGDPHELQERFGGKSFDDIYLEVSGLLARRDEVREMLRDLEESSQTERTGEPQ
ncbi:MAG TPA: ABC transporter ATP-binding protein [Candidatus Dormibacteraeota bacterium]|nr:ABC transporter ATP-binding protein [Candidatus Dormibacteraeota bacterium]